MTVVRRAALTVVPRRAAMASVYRQASGTVVRVVALVALIIAMGGTWSTGRSAHATPVTDTAEPARDRPTRKRSVTGKINLNTATLDQLQLLPSVGPSKAERIVAWRTRNGGFKRTADLRRVKGFGYKTYKRLEPLVAITGETTLVAK